MAKAKAAPKGQKPITAFFGGGDKSSKKKETTTKTNDDEEMSAPEEETEGDVPISAPMGKKRAKRVKAPEIDELEEAGSDLEDDDDGDDAPGGTKPNQRTAAPGIDASDLPPMSDIPTIFSDLVRRIPEIKDVAERVAGRKLRVATMCSGTESPLLALDLIQKCLLEQHAIQFDIEHVFSCEIVPFKQAYIERNFHPPLLFRDVTELGNGEAHTAYGALAPVPGDVDLLVAGTSCVDYSNLNNKKQTIDAHGESGSTFRGMMSWIDKHRPPIVILENVCGAPWDKIKNFFENIDYSASFSRVDTKQFYIPHTRTRVYLVAVDKKGSSVPDKWKSTLLTQLKRPASVTLDAFLLPTDDPRIHQARQKGLQESLKSKRRKQGPDWGRCESRHQRARLEEGLGNKRPLSSWDEGGFCKLPDFAWNEWGAGQVERVWDLMDISLLRAVKKGADPAYKTQVWNLSQNVDRTIGSNRVGIAPCLTPTMIPYITNRGGPMIGLEALSLQGLPIDKLLLTRETEDDLADLAGNAMSSTVVGACILAALVCGKKLLRSGDDSETYESKKGLGEDANKGDAMDVDKPVEFIGVEDRIAGEELLSEHPLDLAALSTHSLSDVLAGASRSARLCQCEGRTGMITKDLFRCVDCDTPFCKACAGRPEHNPRPIDLNANPRLPPAEFTTSLKAALPMSISLSGVSEGCLEQLKNSAGVEILESRWSCWRAAVIRAARSDFRFVETKRQDFWSVVYESSHAYLELFLHPLQPEWRLFAKPLDSEPVNAEIRQLLETPVARLSCQTDLLEGRWDFALPHLSSIDVTLEGCGELVPSWEARLGLTEPMFKDKKVHSQLRVAVSESDVAELDRDISGTYRLIDQCGTANGALYKRVVENESLPPLYLFFDPHRTNDKRDSFVFSVSSRRLQFGESRPVVAKLDPSWRQKSDDKKETVSCHIPCKWVSADNVTFHATHVEGAKFLVPGSSLNVDLSQDSCRSATALLSCSVPLDKESGVRWGDEAWREIDKISERSTFRMLAWVLERVRGVKDEVSVWQEVHLEQTDCACPRCAPKAPDPVGWMKNDKKTMVPVEDPVQAGEYERRLKSRPSPFVTQLRMSDKNIGIVRIGVNVSTLLHRALSRLPSIERPEKPVFSWRLNTSFTPVASNDLPKFVLKSNKQDKQHAQSPNFKIPLRPEQLRSLEWMLKQESKDALPFIEEEISEGIFDSLGWRAEGRAQRPFHVRGGVLADQVGYGKTAITLALTDCAAGDVDKEFKKMGRLPGKIAIRGTLIVVPPHLTRQWESEVKKFMKKGKTCLKIETVSNLNKATIQDFMEADYIFVASNIFKSKVYLENLGQFGGAELPAKEGRYFNDAIDRLLPSLHAQVDLLQDQGSVAVMKEVRAAEQRLDEQKGQEEAIAQSKRLKGKAFREATEAKEKAKKAKAEAEAAKARRAITQPRGDKVEVVIPMRSGNSSAAPSSPSSPMDEDSDEEQRPRRRVVKKKAIVIDDEDDDEDLPKKSRSKVSSKSKKRPPASSDDDDFDDDFTAVSDEEDGDMSASPSLDSEEDEEPPKSKRKPAAAKAKSKANRKPVKKSTASDSDTMDVDTDGAASTSSKKRKSETADERPVKKKRLNADPWKLESKPVRNEWREMQAPPFEMFHYSRVVVDEYTYLSGISHALITRLSSSRRWVLSGTPPIHDFAALKTIAAFLNIHLGVDDDGDTQSPELMRRRLASSSAAELFHSFREVHSQDWHAHRHEIGQRFLDQFVRQNMAEIDEIPWTDKVKDVELPAAERAIYLELEHYLRNLDMTMKRNKKNKSDREKRLNAALGESKSAEEALLKRCSHFEVEPEEEEEDDESKDKDEDASDADSDDDEEDEDEGDGGKKKKSKGRVAPKAGKGKKGSAVQEKDAKKRHDEPRDAMKACDVIVNQRHQQLEKCKTALLKAVKTGLKQAKELKEAAADSLFNEWIRIMRSDEGIEDREATDIIRGILDDAGVGQVKPKAKREEVKYKQSVLDALWEHREHAHEIRRIAKEMVGRVRALRYFKVIRDLQRQTDTPAVVDCPGCDRKAIPIEDVALLSSCGHMGCCACVKRCAEAEECVYAASQVCRSAARVVNIVNASTLGVDDEVRDKDRYFGMKLHRIVELIKGQIPKDERVLVFVQFPDLMHRVEETFTMNKIPFLNIKGTATAKSKSLTKFQTDSEERVLLLNVMDESASGANLTSANHAIFLSPLLASSQEIYTACETQAVGRLVRYGQKKHVHVYRFITTNTIDEEIYHKHLEYLKAEKSR